MSPDRPGKWVRSAALLFFLTFVASSQAFASRPATWLYPPVGGGETGNDSPSGGPGDGGDPDEVYNCYAPEVPVIIPVAGPPEGQKPTRGVVIQRTWPSFWMRILFWSRFVR